MTSRNSLLDNSRFLQIFSRISLLSLCLWRMPRDTVTLIKNGSIWSRSSKNPFPCWRRSPMRFDLSRRSTSCWKCFWYPFHILNLHIFFDSVYKIQDIGSKYTANNEQLTRSELIVLIRLVIICVFDVFFDGLSRRILHPTFIISSFWPIFSLPTFVIHLLVCFIIDLWFV